MQNEEPKLFEFAEPPQAPGNGPAEEPVKRKRGRRRGAPVQRKARPSVKVLSPVTLVMPEAVANRQERLLKAIAALQLLDEYDAQFVVGLFV